MTWESVTHVVFRHGARGPSEGALKPFEGTPIAMQWKEDEVERLSSLGLAQAEELGYQIGCDHKSDQGVDVLWHSSKVDRVIQSGKAFLAGLRRAGCLSEEEFERLIASGPTRIEGEGEDPDLYYRGYLHNEEYKAIADSLRGGEIFASKAREEEDILKALEPQLEQLDLTGKLNCTTYFEEILECERYWNESTKTALTSVTGEMRPHVSRLARWAWDQRFYKLAEAGSLGVPLWQYIQDSVETRGATQSSRFGLSKRGRKLLVVHGAHDYTIMALHCLRSRSYPEKTMGYCCYAVVEQNQVHFNFHPFPSIEPTQFSRELESHIH